MKIFLLRKNDDNFVLQLFVSGQRNKGQIFLDLECDKRFVKRNFGKKIAVLSGLRLD